MRKELKKARELVEQADIMIVKVSDDECVPEHVKKKLSDIE